METLKGIRVLLTGGTGAIGANLAQRLVADGCQVYLLVRPNSNRIRLQTIEDQIKILSADLTDGASVQAAIQIIKPQIVYHLASTPFNPPTISSETHLQVNLLGTFHLLEALRQFPDVKIIFTSSAAAYGAGSKLSENDLLLPGTMLGASKACASILLQTFAKLYQIQTVELRLFTPYGPWEHPRRLIPSTILSALNKINMVMSEGKQQRDYLYIDDVLEAIILAAKKPLPLSSVFNICTGQGIAIRDVVNLTLELMDNPVTVELGALPMRPDEIMEMSGNNQSARQILGWQPQTSLKEGLQKTISWFTVNQQLAKKLIY